MERLCLGLALGLTFGLIAWGPRAQAPPGKAPTMPAVPGSASAPVPLGALSPTQKLQLRRTAVVQAVKRAGKAVVAITSTKNRFHNPSFTERFGSVYIRPRSIVSVKSLGSGVIIDARGYAVTNEHVISQADDITVQLADGRHLKARVVGAAAAYDLAVIKIASKTALPMAVLGNSTDLMAGEPAIAIGNPFGLDQTVSLGVISAPNRTFEAKYRSYVSFIQTDAAINPGNSGGPLVNLAGEVIGINTVKLRDAQGLGFAIPSKRIKLVIKDLLKYGRVRHPDLGLKVKQRVRGLGVVVLSVTPGGPAAGAGIKRGDVILAMRGEQMGDVYVFRRMARALIPGEEIQLVLKGRTVSMTVGGTAAPVALMADPLFLKLMGFQLANASDYADLYKLKTRRGAVIIAVQSGSQAARNNLRPGDVIIGLGRNLIQNVRELNQAVRGLIRGHQYILKVQRGRKLYNVIVQY